MANKPSSRPSRPMARLWGSPERQVRPPWPRPCRVWGTGGGEAGRLRVREREGAALVVLRVGALAWGLARAGAPLVLARELVRGVERAVERELEPGDAEPARDRPEAGARVAAVLDVRLRAGVARPVPVPADRAGRGAEPGARRGEPPRPRSSPALVAGTSGPAARRVGVLRRVVLTAPPLLPGRGLR
jgi:hypothetical protein